MYEEIERLKAKLDEHRPFSADISKEIDSVLLPARVYYSKAFEDSTLTLEETRYYIETSRMVGGKLEREFREVKGLVNAIEQVEQWILSEQELSEDTIRQLHRTLSAPIEQDERYFPGEYRQLESAIIVDENTRINFSPHHKIAQQMTAQLSWYNEHKSKLHPLELAAQFHYRFSLQRSCMSFTSCRIYPKSRMREWICSRS